MISVDSLSAERLRSLFLYEPGTGKFIRIVRRGSRAPVGGVAGTCALGKYVQLYIDGVNHKAHRLAFLYVSGHWPDGVVDHINGDKHDNRWANLRVCDVTVNSQNVRKARSNSKSGVLGVSWHPQCAKWRAQIKTPDGHRHIGLFDRVEDASEAYIRAKRATQVGCTI